MYILFLFNALLLFLTLFLSVKSTAQFASPTGLFYPVGELRYAFASDVGGDGDPDVNSRLFWVPQTSPGVSGWAVAVKVKDCEGGVATLERKGRLAVY